MRLVLGAVTPLHELLRSRDAIAVRNGFPVYFEADSTFDHAAASSAANFDYKMCGIRQYVVGNPGQQLFFRYMAPTGQ